MTAKYGAGKPASCWAVNAQILARRITVAGQKNSGNGKAKAQKLDLTQLVVTAAYGKTFTSGKRGFFGKALDPRTGQKYQIVAAVEIAS